jgi:hypothetical protein
MFSSVFRDGRLLKRADPIEHTADDDWSPPDFLEISSSTEKDLAEVSLQSNRLASATKQPGTFSLSKPPLFFNVTFGSATTRGSSRLTLLSRTALRSLPELNLE